MTKRYEWLDEAPGITQDQRDRLRSACADLDHKYPGEEHDEALEMAFLGLYQAEVHGADAALAQLAHARWAANSMEKSLLFAMNVMANKLIGQDGWNESSLSKKARVTRLTVRQWLGRTTGRYTA